ncbi:hypothetical protein SAMD00024442_6_27 [Candidatus Symbiothrix dinenymphae]|nr:hypothetical protein SAMD00024442_6_27 [Candidatus Symbiothrix dinenymphae]
MPKPNTLEICRLHLFDDKDKLTTTGIPQMLIDRIVRIRAAYTLWLEHPRKKDAEIRDHLVTFGINKSQAYEDIQIIKQLLGDLTETSKAFHRWKFNAMIQATAELAEKKKDYKTMGAAWAAYAKYNQLDKEDALKIPWDEIIPQIFEPSSDPTIIGIKPIANIKERIAALKDKYGKDIAEDIDYEVVDYNEDELFNAPMAIDNA